MMIRILLVENDERIAALATALESARPMITVILMATWTCPDCRRDFGAVGRNHVCSPGLSIDDFVAASPAWVEPVLTVVHAHLIDIDATEGTGDLIVDPLTTKVLFKHGPTFCILDVKTKWVAVGFSLHRKLTSGRLSRKVLDYGDKFFHVINVVDAADVDDEFRDWLTEAYHAGVTARPSLHDPMVPDDVDIW
jgi:hypothetical protein